MGKSNMEERERENFLAAPRIGVISINRISVNSPLATPVWYNYVRGGDVTVLMGRESVKYQLILASGGFTLTAQNSTHMATSASPVTRRLMIRQIRTRFWR